MGRCVASLGVGRSQAATLQQVRLSVTTDEIDEDVATAAQFLRGFGVGWPKCVPCGATTTPTSRSIRSARRARFWIRTRCGRRSSTRLFPRPAAAGNAAGQAALDKEWRLLDDAIERARVLGTIACARSPSRAATASRQTRPHSTHLRITARGGAARAGTQRAPGRGEPRRELRRNRRRSRANAEECARGGAGSDLDPNNAAGEGEHAYPTATRNSTPRASSTCTCATSATPARASSNGVPWATANSTTWARFARS